LELEGFRTAGVEHSLADEGFPTGVQVMSDATAGADGDHLEWLAQSDDRLIAHQVGGVWRRLSDDLDNHFGGVIEDSVSDDDRDRPPPEALTLGTDAARHWPAFSE